MFVVEDVFYAPTKRRLYYSDSVRDDADAKLVNVTYVSHQNAEIERLLPSKFGGRWIKIIGKSSVCVLCGAEYGIQYIIVVNDCAIDD